MRLSTESRYGCLPADSEFNGYPVALLFKMTSDQIAKANAELRGKSPLEIVGWAVVQAKGRAIVSTNFRPYEAVILHLCVQVQPDIPVLWVDHGYNRPATYKHAEAVEKNAQD